jgi:hypothetical protein
MIRHRSNLLYRRGYLLVEVIFWIALMGVFGLAAGRLFHANFRVLRDSGAQTEAARRFDDATKLMRSDVSAAVWELPDSRTLIVHARGNDIRWQAERGGLTRTSADAANHWEFGQPIVFIKDQEILLVQGGTDPHSALVMAREAPQP